MSGLMGVSSARPVVATLASIAAVVPISVLLGILSGDWSNDLWLPYLFGAVFFCAIAVIFFGLPLHFILRRKGIRGWWLYAGAGFLLPLVTTLATAPFGEDGALWVLWQAFILGCVGAAVALVFWRVAGNH